MRQAFRRLPPWQFANRARPDQLACDPRSYVRATQADGRPLYAPMLSWSAGPMGIGVTGDNSLRSLTGKQWLLQVCASGSWMLYREDEDALTVVPFDDAPADVSVTARHMSLAFDQAARIALAWEDTGIVYVRRWNPVTNAYTQDVSFAGVDPIIILDATFSWDVPSSDVLLFYLSLDRERLMVRVQRDVYAIEYLVWDFGVATVLDGVSALPIRYQVLVSDGYGAVLPDLLISDPYPYLAYDYATATAFLGAGAYTLVAVRRQEIEIAVVIAELLSGDYSRPLVRVAMGPEAGSITASLLAGTYTASIMHGDAGVEVADVTAAILSGDYALQALRNTVTGIAADVTAELLGGAYYK